MPIFHWDQSYDVKVEKFNEQHKKLFAMINDLYDSMKEKKANEYLGALFKQLLDYAEKHFSEEEEYMKKYSYDKLDIHAAEHTKFTKTVKEKYTAFNKGKSSIEFETFNFLQKWLTRHIMGMDTLYADLYK